MALTPQFDKGPAEVMRSMASGTPQEQREALEFQRESFRAKFGAYPEECEVVEVQLDDQEAGEIARIAAQVVAQDRELIERLGKDDGPTASA